jgi:hypothetical protein
MPEGDELTTAQPNSGQPAADPAEPTPQPKPKQDDPSPPEGFVETKRFTGAIQKIQTLTEELREKDQQLAAMNSSIEQLKQQQAVRDAEVQAGFGERDKKLETALLEKQKVESETATLRGKVRKVDMAKELGHPELISIIDTIPTFENDDLQKKAMQDIIGFSDSRVKAREESLLAGLTPSLAPVRPPSEVRPTTAEGWQSLIDKEPDSKKRQALFDEWFEADNKKS